MVVESSIGAYLVNTEKLMRSFESDDPAVKEELTERCRYAKEGMLFSEYKNDAPLLDECIDELVHNRVQTDNPDKERIYWNFLFEILQTDTYGPEPEKHWRGQDEMIFHRHFQLNKINNLSGLKMPANGSYPPVYCADNREIEAIIPKIEMYSNYSREAKDELVGWLQKALKHNCDLIIFYYDGY